VIASSFAWSGEESPARYRKETAMCFGFKMRLENGDEVCFPYYVQERLWPPIPPEELDPLGKRLFRVLTR